MVAALEYRLKSGITFDPIVGSPSNFSRGCFPWGSYGMPLGDEDVWSPVLEYRLKTPITNLGPLLVTKLGM